MWTVSSFQNHAKTTDCVFLIACFSFWHLGRWLWLMSGPLVPATGLVTVIGHFDLLCIPGCKLMCWIGCSCISWHKRFSTQVVCSSLLLWFSPPLVCFWYLLLNFFDMRHMLPWSLLKSCLILSDPPMLMLLRLGLNLHWLILVWLLFSSGIKHIGTSLIKSGSGLCDQCEHAFTFCWVIALEWQILTGSGNAKQQ